MHTCSTVLNRNNILFLLFTAKKKQRIDDLLKDTTPISLSSDSLSLSSASSPSRSRSRSPGRPQRHYNDRDRYNRSSYPENILGRPGRRERYDNRDRERHQPYRRRSRSPPRFRSRSPKFRRSRSPNFARRRVSRSPRPVRRSISPRQKGSQSPSIRSKSPSQARSQSSQDVRPRGGGRSRRDKSPDKPLTMRDKWIKFREEADAIEVEMQKQREYHQKNPEKHPLYGEEWKKFWNARYKELQAMGKDPTKHDFKPEWVTYWNSRVNELLDIDFKGQKDALKKKYELVGEEEERQVHHHHQQQSQQQQNFKPRGKPAREGAEDQNYAYSGREYNNSRQEGSVSDMKNTWKALTGGEIQHAPYTGPPREPTWHPPHRQVYPREPVAPVVRTYDNREEARESSVVAVLRLLTALESQLGSFGPKVNTLLAEAISLEKKQTGSSDVIAAKMENIVLFETIKEKFKGLLMAGIVEHFNQKAVRMAITDLTVLLAKAPPPEKVVTPVPAVSTVTSVTPQVPSVSAAKPAAAVEVPGVGTVDKAAIAVQIAEALMAQGRTDVSEAELEQLIDAVVGMAKQSAETNKPVSAASFVKQMENEGQTTKVEKAKDSGVVQEKASSSALKALQTAYNRTPPKKETEQVAFSGFNLSNVAEIGDLAEADLKSCLRIFQHLSTNEQRSLVMYLKKLEDTNPQRVEKLRKYVNLGAGDVKDDEEEKKEDEGRPWDARPSSPFSSRAGGANPFMNESRHGEDSDEEYSFEDVYKAAARNVDASHQRALQEAERKKKEEVAKLKLFSRPSDSNAMKKAIEDTTDNMMATLRDLTQRKDSPHTARGNTPQNNGPSISADKQAPFIGANSKPPPPPPKETQPPLPTIPSTQAVRQIEPTSSSIQSIHSGMQSGHDTNANPTTFQDMGYTNSGYGDNNYMAQQQVSYPGQQYVQYPPPQAQQYSNFGAEPYYQYQQQAQGMYGQQYMAQQPDMQQQHPSNQQATYAQPEANPYHPAQYSASYEKRQQKSQQQKRKW